MTIPSEVNRSGPYTGNGATTAFDYKFKILDQKHIRVISTSTTGVDTDLVLTTNYTVTGVGADGGGQVVLTFPLPAGVRLTLLLNVPFTQEIALVNQGAYYANVVEEGFDLNVMRLQQLQEQISRAVTVPPSADSATIEQLIGNILELTNAGGSIDVVAGVAIYLPAVAAVAGDIPTVAGNTATTIAKAGEAAGSAAAASGSATLAGQYANNPEDVAIPGFPGSFSAKHFMLKCAAILATITNTLAGWIHAATAKTTLNDDDEIGIADSAAAWVLKKISLFNLVRYIASITGQVKISGCETVYVNTTTIQMKAGYVFFNGRRTTFGAAMTKALNAAFVAGAGNGMLDTGAMAASKTYFIHAVRNVATGAGDWVASLQSDPALVNMTNLTGWTVEGRVNVVLTTSGNVIRQYTQDGNEYRSSANVTEISATAWPVADFQFISLPAGISTEAYLVLVNNQTANSAGVVQLWTDLNTGPAMLLLNNNVVSAAEVRITGKLRTRSTGVLRSSAITQIGNASYTVQSNGFNDYTAPRPNGV
ncbi:hypothetical protein HF263_02925 [Rhizobium leguminosarum]|uniref:hypothetical protein n=1 Tax=Rhizobium leguminosarum TaxID=384 RepID=UPI001C8FCD4E|nr:hypothetical protein [Rhizobium leguminosarum]MBY3055032.1 hypothetical protein [Rhizobium leguminosarum]